MTFELDPRLAGDTAFITDWQLCRVMLMNDSRYPWLVLVPRQPALVEIHDLTAADRVTLIEEIARATERLKSWAGGNKMNVGALGNIVRQLHVHVVARRPGDAAGAGPVWGVGKPVPYMEQELARVCSDLRNTL